MEPNSTISAAPGAPSGEARPPCVPGAPIEVPGGPRLDAPLPETLRDWPGSAAEADALALAARREEALRRTGLLNDPYDPEGQAQFDRVTAQVCEVLGVPTALFTLVAGDRQILRAARGFASGASWTPLAESLCRHVRDAGRDLVVVDLPSHPIAAITPGAIENGVGGYLGTPIYAPGEQGLGEPIASLCAIDPNPRVWTARDASALHALADGITTRLALLRSLQETRRERERTARSDDRFRAVLATGANIAWISEREGAVVYVGPQVRDALGIEPDALLGDGWRSVVHPEDLARAEGILSGPIAAGEPYEVDLRLRRADGEWRTLRTSGRPFWDEGDDLRYVSHSADVTDLLRREEEVAAERARLAAVLETIPHVVFTTTIERGLDFVGPQVRELLGREPEELLGFGVYDLIHPDDAAEMRADRATALASSAPLEREIRLRHADGRDVTFLARGFPLDPAIDPEHGHIFTLTDVSAIRAAEAERDEERRRLQGILDVLPTGLMLADGEGRILLANDEARRTFGDRLDVGFADGGWPRAVLLEPDGREIPMDSANAPLLRAMRGESVRGERTIRIEYEANEGGSAEPCFVKCDAAPLRRPDGRVEGAVMVVSDITALRGAEDRIADERREGAERLQSLLDTMPIMAAVVDLAGRLIYVNESAFRNAPHVPRESVIGRVAWETPFTEGLPEAARGVRESVEAGARGEAYTSEVAFEWEGRRVETQYHGAPMHDAEGRIVSVSLSAVDVTDRNDARRRAEAEGAQVRQIMEETPIMMALLDLEGRVLYVNDAPLRAFGLSLADARGRFAWEVPWSGSDALPRLLRDACERGLRGETVVQEAVVVRPDGSAVEIEHRMAPILDESGAMRSLLSTSIDVTARNRALREADAEQARLRTILDILPAGLLIADAEGTIVDGNAEGRRLFGPHRHPADGAEVWPEAWYLEDDGGETPLLPGRGPMHAALAGEAVREPRTVRMRAADGTERFVRCEARPLLGADGAIQGAVMTILDVTDLREARFEADRERLASFERMRKIIDSLPINVVLADPEGRLLYANETPLKALGVTLEDVVGVPAWESPWMPDEATAAITREEYMKAAGGEIAHREFPIRFRDSIVEVDHTVVPILDAEGRVEYLLPSSVDVTARNRALRRVEEERRRLRAVLDVLPGGLVIADPELRVLEANDAARAILDLPPLASDAAEREVRAPDDWAPMFVIDADGCETRESARACLLARALKGEHVREPRTIRVATPRGDRYLLGNAEPLRSADGAIEGAVMTLADVTDLRRAQEAATRERLRGAERLRTTLDGLPIFVALLYPDGRFLYGNRLCFEKTGVTFEEAENVPLDVSPWYASNPAEGRRIRAALDRCRAGEFVQLEAVADARNGEFLEIEVSLSPIYGDGDEGKAGEVRYLVLTALDMRARNAALRQAHDARETAERATRAKDDFLAVLSHELRTPLTPAVLGLELMAADIETLVPGEVRTELTENLAAVRSNLNLQTQLIDDLLDVTRIARGKLELRKRDTDLHDAARHAASITAARAAEKGVALDLDLRAARSVVHADPTRLRQILWNLVANAVKFTPAGGHVRIETFDGLPDREGRPRLVARVVDDGPGIPPEKIVAIFDAFDQGAVGISRGFGGLGLGLAISRSLARAHDATLVAASEGLGHGAVFTLEIPTAASASGEPVAELHRVKRDRKGRRILLIEDNPDTARLTADLLRRAGAEVRVCASVAEALAAGPEGIAPHPAWDLILTDIGLPDGDGLDAVRGLRGLGIAAPAVAMSGYGRDGDKARTTEAGFRAHLVKPVALDRLDEVLDEVLG